MVYCDLVSKEQDDLTYAIGGSPKDMTGKLVVHLSDKSFDLDQPVNTTVLPRHIKSMLSRAWTDFEKGIYKPKLSYEIG